MKKATVIIHILFLLLGSGMVMAQTEPQVEGSIHNNIMLNTPLQEETSLVSSKSIVLKPGFSTQGHTFKARIVPQLFEFDLNNRSTASLPEGINMQRVLTPKVPIKYTVEFDFLNTKDVVEEIAYSDGFGRTLQTQVMGAGEAGDYLTKFYRYDALGRTETSYMPFVTNSKGRYISKPFEELKAFYSRTNDNIVNDAKPYAVQKFDETRPNRVVEAGAQGEAWQPEQAAQTSSVVTNSTADGVMKWQYNYATGQFALAGTHVAGKLVKQTTTDAEGNQVTTYTNGEGQLMLKDQESLRTYYLYDYFGRLKHVLPPALVEELIAQNITHLDAQSELMRDLGYTYIYVKGQLVAEKYLPGVDKIEYVYDRTGRLAMSRNSHLRNQGKWSFIKYDAMGRTIISGLCTDGRTREELQAAMDGFSGNLYETRQGDTEHYSSNTIPKSNLEIHVKKIYDSPMSDYLGAFEEVSGMVEGFSSRTKGLLMHSFVRILDGSNRFLRSDYYYNKKGELIQQRQDNILGGEDRESYTYLFTGQVEQAHVHHTTQHVNEQITRDFQYDEGGRLVSVEQEIANDSQNGKVRMAQMEYNKLGQLVSKKLHKTASGSFLQELNYQYNIRGWLTSINNPDVQGSDNDLFALRLHYNNPGQTNATGLKNGLISAMEWRVFGQNDIKRAYTYQYDKHGRLLKADYAAGAQLNQESGRYSTSYNYKANGQMETLQRNGKLANNSFGLIDNLGYRYDGNQLENVQDGQSNANVGNSNHFVDNNSTGIEYNFDGNGNMVADANKGLTLDYNYLNLPVKVTKDAANYIRFTYDATGKKLARKTVVDNSAITTTFVNGFIYTEGVLKEMQTSEGRVMVNDAGQYKYEYYLRDHLGSVRARFTEGTNHQASLSGEVHYYPFGMTIAGLTVAGESSTDQLFSGKRLLNQNLNGTRPNWYDFGARNYDAQLGMWFNVDPMAEKYFSFSPYNYCFNSPVLYHDPSGREAYHFTGDAARAMFRWLQAKEGTGAGFNVIWNKAQKVYEAYGGDGGGGGGAFYYANSMLTRGENGITLELSNGKSKVSIPKWLARMRINKKGWPASIFGNFIGFSHESGNYYIETNENTTIIHITENSTAPTNDPWGEEAQSTGGLEFSIDAKVVLGPQLGAKVANFFSAYIQGPSIERDLKIAVKYTNGQWSLDGSTSAKQVKKKSSLGFPFNSWGADASYGVDTQPDLVTYTSHSQRGFVYEETVLDYHGDIYQKNIFNATVGFDIRALLIGFGININFTEIP